MATRKKTTKKTASPRQQRKEHIRVWLMYPQKLVKRPVIYELGHKYDVITNVRQATVHDDVGLISLEIEGPRSELDKAVRWLERIGVKVEPVEVNTIEG